MTLLLAVLDPFQHELTLVNAGHPSPYLYQQGNVIPAADGVNMGLPLGVAENADYTQVSYALSLDDRLVMYTDGITEAMSETGELYGLNRLLRQMGATSGGVATDGRNAVRDVKEFVGDRARATTCALSVLDGLQQLLACPLPPPSSMTHHSAILVRAMSPSPLRCSELSTTRTYSSRQKAPSYRWHLRRSSRHS